MRNPCGLDLKGYGVLFHCPSKGYGVWVPQMRGAVEIDWPVSYSSAERQHWFPHVSPTLLASACQVSPSLLSGHTDALRVTNIEVPID